MKVIRLRATAPARYMEFIIRSVPIALREIVKHVHHVEEMLLQELIWKSDSDIWLLMEKYTEKDSPPLPSFHDVAPLSALDDGTGPKSPLRSARVNQMREFIEKFTAGATDTAFITDSASALEWNAKTGKLVIPTSPKELQNRPSKPITPLTALMRKVYSLAAIRLNDLCDRLEISTPSGDLAYYQRLWNALELIIRQRPELLQDRNIDQIIMSTVYIMGLINPKHKKSFQEIMNAYRAQPQVCRKFFERRNAKSQFPRLHPPSTATSSSPATHPAAKNATTSSNSTTPSSWPPPTPSCAASASSKLYKSCRKSLPKPPNAIKSRTTSDSSPRPSKTATSTPTSCRA